MTPDGDLPPLEALVSVRGGAKHNRQERLRTTQQTTQEFEEWMDYCLSSKCCCLREEEYEQHGEISRTLKHNWVRSKQGIEEVGDVHVDDDDDDEAESDSDCFV